MVEVKKTITGYSDKPPFNYNYCLKEETIIFNDINEAYMFLLEVANWESEKVRIVNNKYEIDRILNEPVGRCLHEYYSVEIC